jgi:hypothetical protein
MLNSSSLRPNEEEVAAKVLDGEAIMINLSNGFYYSMDKVGAFIWELVASGSTLDTMVASLIQRYDVSAERAQADLERLVAQLLEENLVLASNDNSAQHVGNPLGESPVLTNESKLTYDPPKLEIYRDIGHLVALDPPMPGLKDLPWNEPTDESSRRQLT